MLNKAEKNKIDRCLIFDKNKYIVLSKKILYKVIEEIKNDRIGVVTMKSKAKGYAEAIREKEINEGRV